MFLGKPIIQYSIEAALNSNLFDEVMVSTDDLEIADIARGLGANIPFMRSNDASTDSATTADVLLEVLNEYERRGKTFEHGCCIYPTAPFVSVETLRQGYTHLVSNNFDSVLPVCSFEYPIWRSLKMKDDKKVSMIWPEYVTTRSQDLEPAYHDAGQFYWFTAEAIKSRKQLLNDNTGMIFLNESEVQDIDTEEDWKIGELKYKLKYGR